MNERRSLPIVFLGDRFLSGNEAPRVSLLDRAYLLGDSVFATLRGYGPRAFGEKEHIERLFEAMDAYGIACPVSRETLNELVKQALTRAGFPSSAVRITVSRGEGDGGFAILGNEAPLLSIVVREIPAVTTTPLRAVVSELRAVPSSCLSPKHKVGSYMSHVFARAEATKRGAEEAILLSATSDAVVSGAASNIFAITQDRIVTPSEGDGARAGVMRGLVLRLARDAGIPIEEGTLTRETLLHADALFFTSSLLELRQAITLDGVALRGSEHPRVLDLQRRLRAHIDESTT